MIFAYFLDVLKYDGFDAPTDDGATNAKVGITASGSSDGQDAIVDCSICEDVFVGVKALKLHMATVHEADDASAKATPAKTTPAMTTSAKARDQPDVGLRCPICDLIFGGGFEVLKFHVNNFHGVEIEPGQAEEFRPAKATPATTTPAKATPAKTTLATATSSKAAPAKTTPAKTTPTVPQIDENFALNDVNEVAESNAENREIEM